MANRKNTLIHLHGITKLEDGTLLNGGEIAVRNADAGTAQLYVKSTNSVEGQAGSVVTFIDETAINSLISSAEGRANKYTSDALVNYYTKTEVNGIKSGIDAAISGATSTLQGQIDALKGDGKGSVADQINDAVTALTAEINKKVDSETYTEDKAELAGDIQEVSTALTTFKTEHNNEYAQFKEANTEAIADAKKAGTDAATALGVYKTSNDARVKDVEDDLAAYKTSNDAAVALKAEKTYVDTELAKKVDTTTFTGHTSNNEIHVTKDLQDKWNTTSQRLETFLGGDTLEDTLDTLHGIQEWMDADGKNASDILGAITTEATNRKNADDALGLRIDAIVSGDTSVGKQIEDAVNEINATIGTVASGKTVVTMISDAQQAAISHANTELAKKADTTYVNQELAEKADKAETLAGYGIGDAYTKTQVDNLLSPKATTEYVNQELAKKADKAETLAGYGIGDAYTKTEVNTKLDGKADKATTLAGYNIGDAYTKTEADTAFGMAKDAVQDIVVTNTTTNKITATKTGTTVTLNFDSMVIDCGTY